MKIWLICAVLLLVAAFSFRGNDAVPGAQPSSGRQDSKRLSGDISRVTSIDSHLIFSEALESFAKTAQDENISEKTLIQWFIASRGGEGFESNLSKNMRAAYRKFKVAVELEQDRVFLEDGMSRSDLNAFSLSELPPAELMAKREALQKLERPPSIDDLVDSLKAQPGLGNEDLRKLFELCERRLSCFESAVADLIDANHVLTDEQFALIDRWLGDIP